MAKTRIAGCFDELISSHDIGLAKQQPGFWQALNRLMPFEPRQTLLVDNSLAVLLNARKYGLENLISVSKPDARQASREIVEFPAITDFSQLMPVY